MYQEMPDEFSEVRWKTVDFSYMWTIGELKAVLDTENYRASPVFLVPTSPKTTWEIIIDAMCLSMKPDKPNECYLRLKLHRLPHSNEDIEHKRKVSNTKVKLSFSILDTNLKKLYSRTTPWSALNKISSGLELNSNLTEYKIDKVLSKMWGVENYIEVDALFKKDFHSYIGLSNGKLIILCEINVLEDMPDLSCFKPAPFKVLNAPPCSELNISTASDSDTLAGRIVLNTVNGSVSFNKGILAQKSPVFSAMFMHNMNEKISNSVQIDDIPLDVLREMLSYLRNGTSSKLQEMTQELLAAADKYAIEDLKVTCEEIIYKRITIENAAETLILADLYSAHHLKKHTLYFILFHLSSVTNTAGYKKLKESDPKLSDLIECHV